jgi:hypothetical protein
MGQRIAFVRQQLERILQQPIVADHLPQLVEKRAIHEIGAIIVLRPRRHPERSLDVLPVVGPERVALE